MHFCEHCNRRLKTYGMTVVQCACPETVQEEILTAQRRQTWARIKEKKYQEQAQRRRNHRRTHGPQPN